jgi:hypothetical protein
MLFGLRSDCSAPRTSRSHGCSFQAKAEAPVSAGATGAAWMTEAAALQRGATPSVSEVHCATASTDCCFVEAVASRTPAALGGGTAFWLNAPADSVALRGCGRFRFTGRIQECDAGVDVDASPKQYSGSGAAGNWRARSGCA